MSKRSLYANLCCVFFFSFSLGYHTQSDFRVDYVRAIILLNL